MAIEKKTGFIKPSSGCEYAQLIWNVQVFHSTYGVIRCQTSGCINFEIFAIKVSILMEVDPATDARRVPFLF